MTLCCYAIEDGHLIKYLFPKGAGGKINVHPWMRDALADPNKTLLVVEGTKQTLAAVSAAYAEGDYAVVGVGGCWGWSRSGAPTPELSRIPLVSRDVVLVFDADVVTNFHVWQAAQRLTDWLYRLHGVEKVRYLIIPNGETRGWTTPWRWCPIAPPRWCG
jgi:DNA polymerase-1